MAILVDQRSLERHPVASRKNNPAFTRFAGHDPALKPGDRDVAVCALTGRNVRTHVNRRRHRPIDGDHHTDCDCNATCSLEPVFNLKHRLPPNHVFRHTFGATQNDKTT